MTLNVILLFITAINPVCWICVSVAQFYRAHCMRTHMVTYQYYFAYVLMCKYIYNIEILYWITILNDAKRGRDRGKKVRVW